MSWQPVKRFFHESHHPLLGAEQLAWSSAEEVLRRLERKLQGRPERGPRAFVFDLDSTLFCTSPRLKAILIRFVHEQMNSEPTWLRAIQAMRSEDQRYSVPETLYHIKRRVLGERVEKELIRDFWLRFEPFWKEEFFSSRNMTYDPPYAGAVDFVRIIQKMNLLPVYLTGRDYDRGMDGTRHALRRWNFPLGVETLTILKPDREMRDMEFKEQIARTLNSRFDIVGVIDNEPENLAMFAERIPESEIIFFHSIMSRRWTHPDLGKSLGERPILGLKSYEI